MIADLLPRYQEAHGKDRTYQILRSMVIQGHEVAWIETTGKIRYDLMKQGREGQTWTHRHLYCECDFTEGVGWKVANDTLYSCDFECAQRRQAIKARQAELRAEYIRKFKNLHQHLDDIVLDLMTKAEAGEFIGEDGNGARFWGGYFYMQLVEAIAETKPGQLWDVLDRMHARNLIDLEGAVVQPYRGPVPMKWEENFRIKDDDDWTGIASLPAHSKMPQLWIFKVIRPDGTSVPTSNRNIELLHEPIFGPDVEDVARAQQALHQLLAEAKSQLGPTSP